MARPKGSKNKPKETPMRVELLDDVLTPQEVADWWKTSWEEIKRQIDAKEIPEDCYFRVGREFKMIKRKLAVLKGILPAA
jgi:hypothetical protein